MANPFQTRDHSGGGGPRIVSAELRDEATGATQTFEDAGRTPTGGRLFVGGKERAPRRDTTPAQRMRLERLDTGYPLKGAGGARDVIAQPTLAEQAAYRRRKG